MAQIVHKFGRNPSLGTAWEDVWVRGGTYVWPQTASQLRVSSASTADTSTGVGARSVTLRGLDANWNPISETLPLTGTSTAVTTASFLRMNRAYVSEVGTYGTLTAGGNQGVITINTGSSAAMGAITVDTSVGMGQTQIARFSSPDGLYMYVQSAFVSVDSNQAADVAFFYRSNADRTSTGLTARRLQLQLDGIKQPLEWIPKTPLGPYMPRSDVWWAAKASAGTQIAIDFEIILSPTTFQVS